MRNFAEDVKRLYEIEAGETRERAALVAATPKARTAAEEEQTRENLLELERLAATAGANAAFTIVQERARIEPATYIGKGKAQELAERVRNEEIGLVIFDDDLSPNQARNLQELCDCKVIDRSGLILDIFASHARTREAQTQVELAQLEYLLPRLTRLWTHLSKQYGGIGTKGPGETQLETDRRLVRARIAKLKQKLAAIDRQRETQHAGRRRFPRVALVGYTNAGKSTLFNAIAHAHARVENRLFATLDASTRIVHAGGAGFLLTDTVGFIRKLPADLVASFRSTLAEASQADVIAHVIDASHPYFEEQAAVVRETLAELGAAETPTLAVFNKIDAVGDTSVFGVWKRRYPNSVFVSALKSINLPSLLDALAAMISRSYVEQDVRLPVEEARAAARLAAIATVVERRYEDGTVTLRLRFPPSLAPLIRRISAESEGM